MNDTNSLVQEFKKALFKASLIWIIVGVVFFRLFSTFELGKALPVQSLLGDETVTCELKADEHFEENLRYTEPHTSVVKAFERSTIGKNLVPNPDFTRKNIQSKIIGYEQNVSSKNVQKSVGSDEDKEKFLRVKYSGGNDKNPVAWIPNPATISAKPYFYSFEYRSTTQAQLTAEYTDKTGKLVYRGLYELPTTGDKLDDWKTIQGHIENYAGDYQSVQLVVSIAQPGMLDIRRPQVFELGYQNLGTSMVSVAFDDGWKTVYDNALPLLDKYHVTSTQFVVAQFLKDESNGYMSLQELKTMSAKGHEVGSHSLSHCDQTALSPSELEKDAKLANKILTESGFSATRGYAYPFGSYDEETQDSKRNYYRYIRSSDDGFNDYYFDISNLHIKSIEASTTPQQVASWIAYAKKHNLWLILLYHQIGGNGDYSTTVSDFESHLKSIKVSGVKTYTIQEALQNINR